MPRYHVSAKRPVIGLFLWLLAAGAGLHCASGRKSMPLAGETPWTEVRRVDPADYPDAGAVFLEDWGRCTLYEQGQRRETVLERRITIQILNERGETYANVVLPYAPGSRISHVQATTLLPDGRTLEVSRNLFFDTEMATESMLYARQRALRFTLPAVRPGAVIRYQWRITLDKGDLWPTWVVQRDEPVLRSQYTLTLPKAHTPRWRMTGHVRPSRFESTSQGTHTQYSWTTEQLPPFKQEFAAPPGIESGQVLHFSPLWAQGWSDVARWYRDQAAEAMRPGDETRDLARSLVAHASGDLDRLRRLFTHVQGHVRYVAIETTQSGFTPNTADAVLRNGYGDCKDMVTALCAMGQVAGLDIRPVLVSTWSHGRVDSTLVTPYQFNHVLAVARRDDGTALWMDPTEKRGGFGQLPWYDQNRTGLEVAPDARQGELVQTPAYPPEYHLSDRHWTVRFDREGWAEGSVSYFLYGAPAMEMRRQLAALPPSEKTDWLLKEAFGRFPMTVDPDIHVENENEVLLPLILSIYFTSPHIMLKSQNLYTLFPDALSTFDYHRLFLARHRQRDIELRHPIRLSDHITLKLPEAWRLVSETQGDTLAPAFGRYQWHLEWLSPRKILLERLFELPQTRIAQEDYPAFRTFLNQVAQSDQTLLLFTPVQ